MRWLRCNGNLISSLIGTGREQRVLRRWLKKSLSEPRKMLVLYSQVAWDDVWQRPQEMALGVSKYRPVLFISPVQTHQPAGQLKDRWKPFRLLNGGRLLVFSPLIASGEYRLGLVRLLNRAILSRYLKPLKKAKKYLFLTNSPFIGSWIDEIKNASFGYDVIDDFCAFDWSPPKGREWEDSLIERCNFGFTGTWFLQEKFGDRLPECEFLASGVSFEKFQNSAPEPDDLKALPGRKILYIGTLNDRIDGELIRETALQFPEDSFIMVGPRRQTFANLDYPGNVHFCGLKPHDELPAFYQHCDLGIMPFADNEAARAINPVKTLEYLASGLPLISTPIPDVERFYSEHVSIERAENWRRAIQKMLAEGKKSGSVERRKFAENRSWKKLSVKVEKRLREIEE